MFAVLTLFGFYQGMRVTNDVAGGRTMAFIILAISQVVHSYNMRSEKSLFKTGVFTNKKLNYAALLSLSVSYTHLPQVRVKWKRMWDFRDN